MAKRTLASVAIVCLCAWGAAAASDRIEAAIQTFKTLAADPEKFKLFCALDAAQDAAADKRDTATATRVADLIKQLGPDFESAWNAADDVDDDSPDGQAFLAALEDIAGKCR
jgi:hypothetical protein